MNGLSALHRLLIGTGTINARSVVGTIMQPAHAESLRIEIHQRRRRAAYCVVSSDICCEGGLATTTFGIQHDNLVKIASIRCNQHRSAGVSPSPLANNQHELPPLRNEKHFPRLWKFTCVLLQPILHKAGLLVQHPVPASRPNRKGRPERPRIRQAALILLVSMTSSD